MGGALCIKNWGGGEQCRDEKERRDSFQEHLLNRRLRPGLYFTAWGAIVCTRRGFRKIGDQRLHPIFLRQGGLFIYRCY
jgi:hypothetical protein